MRIYLLRHADALDAPNDADRPLSSRGKRESKLIGKFLKKAGIELDAAYASPLLRARTTAEIVLHVSGAEDVSLDLDPSLTNEFPQDAFDLWISRLDRFNHLLLVGHMPTLAERAARFLGLPSGESIPFPKAGLLGLDLTDRHHGTPVFFISPEQLAPKG